MTVETTANRVNGNGATLSKEELLAINAELNNMFKELATNVSMDRSSFFRQLLDPRRDIDGECGYPKSLNVDPNTYRDLYDREPIANRVVHLFPRECWQKPPAVYEDEDKENITEFEKAWDELDRSLSPHGKSWYKGDEGSIIWSYLQRLNELSGIGQFGVLLLGLDDGRNLQDPADGVEVFATNGARIPDSPMSNKEKDAIEADLEAIAENQNSAKSTGVLACNYNREMLSYYANKVDSRGDKWPLPMGGRAPDNGPFITGGEQHYGSWGLGLPPAVGSPLQPGAKPPQGGTPGGYGQSGASLSGTDQQYFGVQFGPSEVFSDEAGKEERQLLFMRVFDESLVQVVRYEWNIRNPRFGLPVMYRITLNDPRQPHSGVGLPLATIYVHWSRVIHVADNLVVSEIFGAPRLRPVLNPVLDIVKVRGGSGEMYWRGAFPGLSLETVPQLGADVIIDDASIKSSMQSYMQGLQRYFTLSGMSAKTLAPQVVDPSPQIERYIEAICIQLGCPVRVFKGSERGELASTQDDESWNERKLGYQNSYITPRVIVPFIDRLISLGVLPEPTEGGEEDEEPGYWVEWPAIDALSDTDKATIGNTKTTAMAAYVSGNVEAIMPPKYFFTEILGMKDEIVEEMLTEAASQAEDTMTMPAPGELGHPATPEPEPLPPVLPGGGKPGGAGGAKPPGGGAAKPATAKPQTPKPAASAGAKAAAGQTPPASAK